MKRFLVLAQFLKVLVMKINLSMVDMVILIT